VDAAVTVTVGTNEVEPAGEARETEELRVSRVDVEEVGDARGAGADSDQAALEVDQDLGAHSYRSAGSAQGGKEIDAGERVLLVAERATQVGRANAEALIDGLHGGSRVVQAQWGAAVVQQELFKRLPAGDCSSMGETTESSRNA